MTTPGHLRPIVGHQVKQVDGLAANATAAQLRHFADLIEADPAHMDAFKQFLALQYAPGVTRQTKTDDGLVIEGAGVLRDDPPPHRPVLAELFDWQALVEVVGPSKTRKSFAVIQLALSLAARRDVFGFEIGGAFSVCIADLELSEADIRRRLWRMGRALGITPKDIEGRLRILSLAGADDIRQKIETGAAGFDILICDPLYALCDGGEKIEDLREPLRWLRRLAVGRAACLFIHHDGKGSAGDRDTRDRGSGSGITGRAVDARITLTPAAADPDNTVVMGFMCRSYVTPEPRAYTFADDAFRLSDLPAEPERQSDRRVRQNRPKLAEYRDAAVRILRVNGPMPPSAFKTRLRNELGLSKDNADMLTSTLCSKDGPAQRWAKKSFPPEHFIGLKEQSSLSSCEDCREDQEDSSHGLPARLIGREDRTDCDEDKDQSSRETAETADATDEHAPF